jgi:hypothetical protein
MTNRRQLGILPECPSLRIASWMWWFWPVLGERVTAAVARTRFLRAGVTAPIPEPVADVAIKPSFANHAWQARYYRISVTRPARREFENHGSQTGLGASEMRFVGKLSKAWTGVDKLSRGRCPVTRRCRENDHRGQPHPSQRIIPMTPDSLGNLGELIAFYAVVAAVGLVAIMVLDRVRRRRW